MLVTIIKWILYFEKLVKMSKDICHFIEDEHIIVRHLQSKRLSRYNGKT